MLQSRNGENILQLACPRQTDAWWQEPRITIFSLWELATLAMLYDAVSRCYYPRPSIYKPCPQPLPCPRKCKPRSPCYSACNLRPYPPMPGPQPLPQPLPQPMPMPMPNPLPQAPVTLPAQISSNSGCSSCGWDEPCVIRWMLFDKVLLDDAMLLFICTRRINFFTFYRLAPVQLCFYNRQAKNGTCCYWKVYVILYCTFWTIYCWWPQVLEFFVKQLTSWVLELSI